jgi:hypothetical protein
LIFEKEKRKKKKEKRKKEKRNEFKAVVSNGMLSTLSSLPWKDLKKFKPPAPFFNY